MGHEPYCNLYFFFKDSNQEFVYMDGGFKHYPVPEELEKTEATCRELLENYYKKENNYKKEK